MSNISLTYTTNSRCRKVCGLREKMLLLPLVVLLCLFLSRDASAQTTKEGTLTVAPATLSFVYKDAPGRPVTEFTAVVTERNKSYQHKPEQKCSEPLNYEPGNYHIEINTFPKDVRNVDINGDQETVITIQQPGFAQFTSTDSSVNEFTLYMDFGDKYRPIDNMELENPASKNLRIQPGRYEAHYRKGAGRTEQVKRFVIKPTKTTEVILN